MLNQIFSTIDFSVVVASALIVFLFVFASVVVGALRLTPSAVARSAALPLDDEAAPRDD